MGFEFFLNYTCTNSYAFVRLICLTYMWHK
jgi:hypothetical protein